MVSVSFSQEQKEALKETINTCRLEVEYKILEKEGKTLEEITAIKKDISALKEDVEELITRHEFAPVKLIAFGLAGGVLIAALSAVLFKTIGW
jgi:hypothetical protein